LGWLPVAGLFEIRLRTQHPSPTLRRKPVHHHGIAVPEGARPGPLRETPAFDRIEARTGG
jgi:hypothetical protein